MNLFLIAIKENLKNMIDVKKEKSEIFFSKNVNFLLFKLTFQEKNESRKLWKNYYKI